MPRTLSSEDWDAMCDRIAHQAGPVSWRWAAALNPSGGWGLTALVVDLGERAEPILHTFPSAILAVEELDAAETAGRLREGLVVGDQMSELDLSLPVSGNAVPQWIYSWEQWGLTEPGWPRLIVETGGGSNSYVDPHQPLLFAGLPFYPSFSTAVAERVFCVSPERLRLNQHALVSIRITDRRGRIAAPEIEEEGVLFTVEEGEKGELNGFALRVAWRGAPENREWSRNDFELTGPRTIEMATSGVPSELVVALVDPEGFEVDRRSWDERLDGRAPEPESLETLVARWLEEGEHTRLEYKQSVSEMKVNVSLAETVAAFANGSGGIVLVGVDDNGQPVGYDAAKASDQITNIIADRVEEPPSFAVDEVRVKGRPLFVIRVDPSPRHRLPHQVNGRVMVRTMATTRPATPGQLRELTKSGESEIVGLG